MGSGSGSVVGSVSSGSGAGAGAGASASAALRLEAASRGDASLLRPAELRALRRAARRHLGWWEVPLKPHAYAIHSDARALEAARRSSAAVRGARERHAEATFAEDEDDEWAGGACRWPAHGQWPAAWRSGRNIIEAEEAGGAAHMEGAAGLLGDAVATEATGRALASAGAAADALGSAPIAAGSAGAVGWPWSIGVRGASGGTPEHVPHDLLVPATSYGGSGSEVGSIVGATGSSAASGTMFPAGSAPGRAQAPGSPALLASWVFGSGWQGPGMAGVLDPAAVATSAQVPGGGASGAGKARRRAIAAKAALAASEDAGSARILRSAAMGRAIAVLAPDVDL